MIVLFQNLRIKGECILFDDCAISELTNKRRMHIVR